jgi:hypothetical protein
LLYAGTPLELYGTRNSVKPIYIVIADKTSENPKDWAISRKPKYTASVIVGSSETTREALSLIVAKR